MIRIAYFKSSSFFSFLFHDLVFVFLFRLLRELKKRKYLLVT